LHLLTDFNLRRTARHRQGVERAALRRLVAAFGRAQEYIAPLSAYWPR